MVLGKSQVTPYHSNPPFIEFGGEAKDSKNPCIVVDFQSQTLLKNFCSLKEYKIQRFRLKVYNY